MTDKYILDGHEAVPCDDLMTWAQWFETGDRLVARAYIDTVRVSTVFLGLNHRYTEGPPLLFETMVFGGPLDQEQDRYTTWDEAEAGHQVMVQRVTEAQLHKAEGMNHSATLTLREFLAQLAECGLTAEYCSLRAYRDIEEVIIRTADGDHGLAAVHREEARLILDLGNKLEEP